MAKTKKNLKFKKNKKINKKINKSKKTRTLNYNNSGFSEFIYKENNKAPQKTIIKWNNDGNNTKINMNTTIDGKEKKTTLNLSDDKIKKLLGSMTTVDKPIDQRLINDFSVMLPSKKIILPFNLTEEPVMRDSDIIHMSSIKGNKTGKK
jgi:hypothetical protein